jgi:prepilin-type N-terminal cleavage/methylation domain-containing protein
MGLRTTEFKSQQLASIKDRAFSLLELVVVLAGLGILASLAIPNYLRYLQEAKNDEATAFLNAVASECLQMYRSDGDLALEKSPDTLQRNGAPQDFKLEEGDDECKYISISPKNESDTILASFSFFMRKNPTSEAPYMYKTSSYAHPDAETACMRWASFKETSPGVIASPKVKACEEGGDVEAIRARIAAEAAERERLRQIEQRYQAWLTGPPPGTGNYKADGKDIWAFQGRVIAGGKTEFDKVVEQECGKELVQALDDAKSKKSDGPFTYTGKNGGCSINTYLCSGSDVGDKDGYDACKEEERKTRCTAAEGRWKNSGINGKFSEAGCEVKWQCNKSILTSQDDYDKSSCSTPPRPICTPPANPPWYCPYLPEREECKCK